MRSISNPNRFQKLFSFILCLSILSGSFPIGSAQTNFQANQTSAVDRDKSYAELFRRGRGSDFERLLTKNVGAADVENIQRWLDENNAGLFRTLDTAFQNEAEQTFEQKRKNNKASESKIAPKPSAPKPVVPAKRKPSGVRRAAFDSSENVFFRKASYNPSDGDLFNQSAEEPFNLANEPEDLAITKIKTDDGFQMKGAIEKTKTVGDVTITQGATGDTRAIMVEGGNVGTEFKGVEYVEAVNKKERQSLRTETTISWRVLTASCPDADGISAGSGTVTNAFKMTITNPQTIGILTRDITTRMTIKGVVNDAAELTHFDLEGAAVETISGYERAERLGLIKNSEFADGTKQLNYRLMNNKLGVEVKDDYGFTKAVGGGMGKIEATSSPEVSPVEAKRINEIAASGVVWLYEQAAMYLKTAQSNWRYYGCVEIVMTAPKTALRPAEQTEVNAETVHKFDKSKVNAELTLTGATDSAAPEKQNATPQGKFNLTAPPKGENARISVESVSRRGIALNSLDFGEEKPTKKPVAPKKTPTAKKCDGAWTGKITAVKRTREEIVKPASGRLVREIDSSEETFSIDYYVLGIQDTTGGFTNGYFADAQMNYRSTKYNESNYAAGKTSCDKKIISTTETRKLETLMTALSSKRITVYISPFGKKGTMSFGSPEINAERIVTRTYETSCPSYDRVNSGVDRSGGLIEVPSPSFEIEFELDAKSAYLLAGSKTIQNSDGGETIVTWNLTRDCK
jgi:hypothetical protein